VLRPEDLAELERAEAFPGEAALPGEAARGPVGAPLPPAAPAVGA
jgi:hypothetical protein